MLHKWKAFAFLSFYKRTPRFTPAIPLGCTVPSRRLADPNSEGICRPVNLNRFTPTANKVCSLYPFSPERKMFRRIPFAGFNSLISYKWEARSLLSMACLRELHSLTVSESVRFLYPEGAAGKLNFPQDGLKKQNRKTVTEVKLVFSHIACSPEAIWEDRSK